MLTLLSTNTFRTKIKESYELLIDPAKRKEYDAEYDGIWQAVKRLVAERRAARAVDSKRSIVSNLRLDQPITFEDGSPMRDHCVVHIIGLPPQVTVVDLVRAIAEISPVGRVIDARLMKPSLISVDRSAFVEFADDASARRLGLLAFHSQLNVLGKRIWHCRILPANRDAMPPGATRVLVIDGPRDHKLMTVSAMGEFFGRNVDNFDDILDSYGVVDSAKGPNSVTMQWVFTRCRGGAFIAFAALRRHYPELSVTDGADPCE